MKKGLYFSLIILFFLSIGNLSGQNLTDEYGIQNHNSYLGGLGLTISYGNVLSHPDFNIDTAGTLEAWINPTSITGTTKSIISKGASTNVSFLFGIYGSSGKLFVRIGSTEFFNSDGAALPANQWTHVAVSWNKAANYTVSFFINGAMSGAAVTAPATFYVNTDAIRIGGSQAFPTYVFQGTIDEVRLWKRSRTANQIACNRFVGLGDGEDANSWERMTYGSYYNGLVSTWTFNSSGTTFFDYFGYHHGTYVGSAASTQTTLGVPIPYNFAMKFNGAQYDFLTVSSNSVFNQTSDGSIEMWIKPISVSTEQIFMSKGSSLSSLSFILGMAPGGKLYFGTATNVALNSTGQALTANVWNHIVVTWMTSGSTFQVRFYKNGKQSGSVSTIPNTFPTNTDALLIGSSALYNLPFNGYIDELRIWNQQLTQQQILLNMFVSGRSITTPTGLLCFWNFDGNLNNFTSTSGIAASLNSGGVNNCRLSAYYNDNTTGAYNSSFQSHSTVINRAASPNPFPGSYYCRYPFGTIPDNNPTGLQDTLVIQGISGYVTSLELFLSIQHSYVGDLIVTLRAPSGVERNIIVTNGGGGKNVLTFFSDNFSYMPTDNEYLPPWGFLKTVSQLNSFNTSAQGNWILTCKDNATNDVGILQGWGIKFTTATGVNPVSGTVPDRYSLGQNYPNPFNPSTSIKFGIKKDGFVSLKIYDLAGRQVDALVSGTMKAGSYSVDWNASGLSSGVYFYKLEAGEFTDVKRMALVK